MSEPLRAPAAQTQTEKVALAFLLDHEAEAVLRESIPTGAVTATYRRGGLKEAIRQMAGAGSPSLLVVDISDCEADNSVLSSLEELAGLVEPDTEVVAVANNRDVAFYRQMTRAMGVTEVLHKPITRLDVSQLLLPIVMRDQDATLPARGGRVISVIGAKGGVGASTIAVGLTRFMGETARRHTILIDADLRRSACSIMLRVPPETPTGLRQLLERPERIDRLFVERAAAVIQDRIHLLAGDEKPTAPDPIPAGSADLLIEILRMRYNFVVIDLPIDGRPLTLDLLRASNHKVLVMDPSLVSLKEAHKILQLEPGPTEPQRPTVVLNRANARGGVPTDKLRGAGEMKIDVEIPDLGHSALAASNMEGDLMALKPFRTMIETIAREVGAIDADALAASSMKSGMFGRLFGR